MERTQSGFDPALLAEEHQFAPNFAHCYGTRPDKKDLLRFSPEILGGEHFPPVIGVKPDEDTSEIPRFVLLRMA
jgi:hypothetical protein